MSSYSSSLHQIVFSTKERAPVLLKSNRYLLYKFLWGLCENKKCKPFAINGVADHVHIILSIHPTTAVSNLVKDLKISSSLYIKEKLLFPDFTSWQTGYGHFTYSVDAKPNLVNYVDNQEEHHNHESSKEELIRLLKEHGVDYDPKYLE